MLSVGNPHFERAADGARIMAEETRRCKGSAPSELFSGLARQPTRYRCIGTVRSALT